MQLNDKYSFAFGTRAVTAQEVPLSDSLDKCGQQQQQQQSWQTDIIVVLVII